MTFTNLALSGSGSHERRSRPLVVNSQPVLSVATLAGLNPLTKTYEKIVLIGSPTHAMQLTQLI